MQLLSIHLFQDVMAFLPKEEGNAHVHQSLIPLLFHLHDENKGVAEVRNSDLLVSPWERAWLPAAPAPHGLPRSSLLLALATEQQLWGTSVLLPWQHHMPEMGADPLLCPGTEPSAKGHVPQLLRLPSKGQERP